MKDFTSDNTKKVRLVQNRAYSSDPPTPERGVHLGVVWKYIFWLKKQNTLLLTEAVLPFQGSGVGRIKYNFAFNTILFILLLFVFTACATREEGCTDALATNFDLGADKPCKSCCEYPGVRIRFTHKYGSTAIVYNQPLFTDGAGNAFAFGDLRFYLSNIQLVSVGNRVIDVQEPLDVYVEKAAGDTLKTSLPNSYGLARGVNQTDIYVQSYHDTATVNRIRFTVGIGGEMNQANPLRLPSDHPLRSSTYDGMYLGAQNGYVFTRALYYAQDTVDVKISGSNNLRTIELAITPTKIQRGYNLNVLMDVDYSIWFKSVNVNTDTPAQISQKILEKLAQSFVVTQVSTGL